MKKSYLNQADKSFRNQDIDSSQEISRVMSASRQKRNSVSYKSNPKPLPSRSISVTKDPTSKQINLPVANSAVLGLDFEEIHRIFLARCEDLNISIFPDQEKRFFNYCWLHFKDRKFEMSESGIGSKSAKVIGNILKNNTNYAFINLSKNTIKDSGALELFTCLKNSMHIVHLDISSNEITPEGGKVLLKMLETNESLVSLNISSHEGLHRNRLCTEGGEALSLLLEKNQILTYLNVSGTSLGPDGLALLLRGLESNLILQSLNLANNAIGSKAIESLAVAMPSTDIKDLNLAGNKIGNEGCEFLSKMLSGDYDGFCTVAKLDLSDNEISTKGLALLLAAMRINTQLSSVLLRKNNFFNGLSENFLQFLTDNLSMDTLDLSQCNLRCTSLTGIGEGLSRNKALKSLNLAFNKIQDRGVEVICYGLLKNQSLSLLDLTSNEVKNKGALSFAKALKSNSTLESLLLKDNSIKDTGGQALCESVRFNKNICKMSLELNPMNFKFITEAKDLARANEINKKKKTVPVLVNALERSKNKGKNIEAVFSKIGQKKKEKTEIENKVKVQGEKLDQMKMQEREKLDELKTEYSSIRSLSFALSAEIENLHSQIQVSFMQRVKLQGDKHVSELSNKIGITVNQIKQNDKASKIY